MNSLLLLLLGAATAPMNQSAITELAIAEQIKAYAMVMQAQSSLIKANADAFKTRIDAMESYQKATKSKLDNEMLYTKNFYDKRQMRNAYQDVQAMSRYNGLTIQKSEAQLTKAPTPQPKVIPASYKQSIPSKPTDVIKWPVIFLRQEFEIPRKKMELFFIQRKQDEYGPTSFFYYNIYKLRNEMLMILQTVVKDVSTAESIFARKFLDQAIYEANK